MTRVSANGQSLVCLYDRQDPVAGQVVVAEAGLVLLGLLDGERTPSAVRAAFMLRTGLSLTEEQVRGFVEQLDDANLLASERYQDRLSRSLTEFRAAASRAVAHAGGAYPGDPDELRAFLDSRYLLPIGPGRPPGPPSGPSSRALIAPHIDLHRGGHSYAWGYRELAEREPAELYVLLGTCHVPMAQPFAVTTKAYETPFGPAPTDRAFVERLRARAPFDIFSDEYCHRGEHSLEFQSLYLRYLGHVGNAGAPIVPILCVPPTDLRPGATPAESPLLLELLSVLREELVQDSRRVCLVAGADFAHIGPRFGDPVRVDERLALHVRAGDMAMLEIVARGDADGFYRQVVEQAPGDGMAGDAGAVGGARRVCGLAPIYALLWLLGPSEGRVIHYDQWIDRGGAGSVTFGCVLFP